MAPTPQPPRCERAACRAAGDPCDRITQVVGACRQNGFKETGLVASVQVCGGDPAPRPETGIFHGFRPTAPLSSRKKRLDGIFPATCRIGQTAVRQLTEEAQRPIGSATSGQPWRLPRHGRLRWQPQPQPRSLPLILRVRCCGTRDRPPQW